MGKIPIGLAKVAGRLRTHVENVVRETAAHAKSSQSAKPMQKAPDKNLPRTFRRHGHKFK